MCTAMTYHTKDFYFGRNLDYPFSYKESVTITPRNFCFPCGSVPTPHHAILGMAYIKDGYPLYYDAVNEHGLCMAGLNFPGNAVYLPPQKNQENLPTFALIPWVLGQCKTVAQAHALLKTVRLTDEAFSEDLPPTPLHWMIADKDAAIVVEPTKEGVMVYDNPAGVLTNNPPFPMQMFALNNLPFLSIDPPNSRFCHILPLDAYSAGLGSLGLPGDLSSQSRFVRGTFCRLNARSGHSETESVSQFFHMLGFVEQPRGCVRLASKEYELTLYSSCINASRGIYYYTTYENRRICAVDLHQENLAAADLISYPLLQAQDILFQNFSTTVR